MEEQTFEIWESQHFIGKDSKDFWKQNKRYFNILKNQIPAQYRESNK